MAKSQTNRGGTRQRRTTNHNPEGHNQYSNGLMDMARERPVAAAAAAAGAVAAGVFLWSKRAQISDQISQLSDQFGEWTDSMPSAGNADSQGRELETVGASGLANKPARRAKTTTATARGAPSNGSAIGASENSPIG